VRALFLTHRLPYAPNRGDRIRAFNIVRALAPRMDLEVVSLVHDDDELQQVGRVEALGARVAAFKAPAMRNRVRAVASLTGSRPLTHVLLDAPGLSGFLADIARSRPPDVVLAYCSGMARFALEPPLTSIPLVLDMVDVDSAKWAALAPASPWPKRWVYRREAHWLGRFEQQAALKAHVTLVVNERERSVLQSMTPAARVQVVGIGVDLAYFRPPRPPTEAPRVVFCGVMDYGPNVEGILWFARDIWPAIRARRPEARLTIVGARPATAVRHLASVESGIEVTGTVADVREYLWDAAVSVAPLLTARGLQTKVLETLAAGLPSVVTPQVFEGLPENVRAACRVSDEHGQFADDVLALLNLTGHERRAVASRASLDGMSWDALLAPLPRILAEAAARCQ
jgi:sugar transferase (PEP-CTERM/EpsH1 system associated)